jgi:hypothetical protein
VIVNAIIWNNTARTRDNVLAVVGGLSQVTYSARVADARTETLQPIPSSPLRLRQRHTFTAEITVWPLAACYNKGLTESWMSTAMDLDRLPR